MMLDQQQFGQEPSQTRSKAPLAEQDIAKLNQQEQEELLRQLQEQMRGMGAQLDNGGHNSANAWNRQ